MEGSAKTVGYSDNEVKEKFRKKLVSLIEERLDENLKGTEEKQKEYLENVH